MLDYIKSAKEVEEEKLQKEENKVRRERNKLLSESDWTQVEDAPVEKESWAKYRQELRDITKQSGYPFEVDWPEKP